MPLPAGYVLDLDSRYGLYDATSGGSAVADGGAVARWEDQSGNGHHATQGTAADRPAWHTGQVNKQPAVRFDGGSDHLNTAALALGPELTVFSVCRTSGNTGGGANMIFSADEGGATRIIQFRSDSNDGSSQAIPFDSGGNPYFATAAAPPRGQFARISTRRSASDCRVFVDGQGGNAVGTGGTPASGTRTTTIGGLISFPSTFLNGDIARLVVYPSALGDADRSAAEAYLANLYFPPPPGLLARMMRGAA